MSDASTLEVIAEGLGRARMPFQAEKLREIAGRVRKLELTIDEIVKEMEEDLALTEGMARVRAGAIERGEVARLLTGRQLSVVSGQEPVA